MEEYNEEQISQMIQMAWSYMDLGEYDEAEQLAEQLLEVEAEAGYPLMAGIMALKEDPEGAIELLKKGVNENPNSWRLKLELGNLYGQLQKTAVATAIFDEAAQMPGAEVHWIEMNRGIAYFKGGMFDEALNTLQQIDHPKAINEAFSVQLDILDLLGQHQLIINMAEEELALLSDPEDQEEGKTLANVFSRVAVAYWYEDEENTDAIQLHLRRAIEYDRTNEIALGLFRELNQEFSDDSRLYELMLGGFLVVPDEDEEMLAYPFVCDYVVIADSPQDALDMIKEFEIDQVDRASLEILEVESGENEEEDAVGIYYVGELTFIDGEDEADDESPEEEG